MFLKQLLIHELMVKISLMFKEEIELRQNHIKEQLIFNKMGRCLRIIRLKYSED